MESVFLGILFLSIKKGLSRLTEAFFIKLPRLEVNPLLLEAKRPILEKQAKLRKLAAQNNDAGKAVVPNLAQQEEKGRVRDQLAAICTNWTRLHYWKLRGQYWRIRQRRGKLQILNRVINLPIRQI